MDDAVAAHVGLCNAYVRNARDLRLGRHWLDSAVEEGRKALALDPNSGEVFLALGSAYRNKGWLRDELALWQRRATTAPQDPEASERIGWILWFTGHAEEAMPSLSTTVKQRPDGYWGQFYLGNANLALENFSEAERMYRRLLEQHPAHSSARAGVIWSLLAAGMDETALRELQVMQASTLDDDRYLVKVSDIEHFMGQDALALGHARAAIVQEPEERYWPRGYLPSTIAGSLLWPVDRSAGEEALGLSAKLDSERIDGGDEGYLPHIDLAAVNAIKGDNSAAVAALSRAIAAGWRGRALALRDPLYRFLHRDPAFEKLMSRSPAQATQ